MLQIEFDGIVFKEGETYISYCPKLDVSSCGRTIDEARKNLKIAVDLFVEEAGSAGFYHQEQSTLSGNQPRRVF
jgi:predicted RNase H-like HicB family nuclease